MNEELVEILNPQLEYQCDDDFYTHITYISNLLERGRIPKINPGYLKDIIGFFDERKAEPWNLLDQTWRIQTYKCDNADDKLEISLSLRYVVKNELCLIYLDRYGNCYDTQEMLLASLSYENFQIYAGNNLFGNPINKPELSLTSYEPTIIKLLGEKGEELWRKFNDSWRFYMVRQNIPLTEKLQKMKVVFPFFCVLSDPELPEIQFGLFDGKIEVKLGRRNFVYFYTTLNYADFSYFKKYVKNSSNICAFQYSSMRCLHKLMDAEKINDYRNFINVDGKIVVDYERPIKFYNKKLLEEYIFAVNQKFGYEAKLATECHKIACSIMINMALTKPCNLSNLKYIVFWVRWKLQKNWNDTTEITMHEKTSLIQQYYKLFNIVDPIQTANPTFLNSFSATYHAHVHYVGVKEASTNHLIDGPDELVPPVQDFRDAAGRHQLLEDMRQLGNIEISDPLLIEICVKFYLNTVSSYLFNILLFSIGDENFYAEEKERDDGSKCEKYYYSKNLFGVKGIFEKKSSHNAKIIKKITTYYAPFHDECSDEFNSSKED